MKTNVYHQQPLQAPLLYAFYLSTGSQENIVDGSDKTLLNCNCTTIMLLIADILLIFVVVFKMKMCVASCLNVYSMSFVLHVSQFMCMLHNFWGEPLCLLHWKLSARSSLASEIVGLAGDHEQRRFTCSSLYRENIASSFTVANDISLNSVDWQQDWHWATFCGEKLNFE